MRLLSVFLLITLLALSNPIIAQYKVFTLRGKVYDNVDSLRNGNMFSMDQFDNFLSLDDTTLTYFTFDSVTVKNGFGFEEFYYYDLRKIELLELKFYESSINGTFDASGIPLSLQIDNSNFKTLDLQGSRIQNMIINGCNIDTLLLDGASITNIVIKEGKIGYVSLIECHNISSLIIDNKVEITSIALQDFRPPTDGNVFIKIGCAKCKNPGALLLADSKTDFQRIDLDYQNFNLMYVDEGKILDANSAITSHKGDVVRSLYHTILKKFEESGQSDNYLRLYRHKRDFEAVSTNSGSFLKDLGGNLKYFFTYTLPDWWWGFGFEKQKIFRNTLLIFFVWLLVGCAQFRAFLNEYPAIFDDKELGKKYKDKHTPLFAKIGIATIGIAILFFGIEFKANQLKFDNKIAAAIIILIYASGLLCLAFLANLILTV